jgi:hypothetical protein
MHYHGTAKTRFRITAPFLWPARSCLTGKGRADVPDGDETLEAVAGDSGPLGDSNLHQRPVATRVRVMDNGGV